MTVVLGFAAQYPTINPINVQTPTITNFETSALPNMKLNSTTSVLSIRKMIMTAVIAMMEMVFALMLLNLKAIV